MPAPERRSAGFTLIELLIVISLIGILASLAIVDPTPGIRDQLYSTSELVAADVAWCQSLALAHNSSYQIEFDDAANRYVLTHSGDDTALDTLPTSPFHRPTDPADQHIVDLDELPTLGPRVRIYGVVSKGSTPERLNGVEFGPLGETTGTSPTVIWLSAGQAAERRYLGLRIEPITGLVSVEAFQSTPPVLPASVSI